MDIQILAVPYDSGHRGLRMGAGPEALLDSGLVETLRGDGHTVHVQLAELNQDQWQAEIESSFELMRMLAGAVSQAREAGRFPIVLAGNCNTAVGTIAGLGADSVAVTWFDAHADFNTPETTTSGFLDGTAVAIISGRCWTQLALTVPGFSPVRDDRICLIGTRDIDSLESALLDDSSVTVVAPRHLRESLPGALRAMNEHAEYVYLHLDLDVLDSAVAAANQYAVPDGLSMPDMDYCLSRIGKVFRVAAVSLTAYDPIADKNGAAAKAAVALIRTAARVAQAT